MAEDYLEELDKWADPEYYDRHVRKIQLPFTPAPSQAANSVALEQQQQRRKENVRRLVEINAKKREERVSFPVLFIRTREQHRIFAQIDCCYLVGIR